MRSRPRMRTWRERWHRMMRSKDVRIGAIRLTADDALVGKDVQRLLYRGDYEYAELQLVAHVLRPDDRVLEIGAGMGAVGLTVARIIGQDRITSFEANPELEPLIRTNYALNGLFPELIMKAITPDGAPVSFNVTPSLLSSSVYDRGEARPVTVASMAIKDAIKSTKPTVLVIDAEGSEVDLLPASDLTGIRAILVECHARVTGADQVDKMTAYVLGLGFRIEHDMHRNLLMTREWPGPLQNGQPSLD